MTEQKSNSAEARRLALIAAFLSALVLDVAMAQEDEAQVPGKPRQEGPNPPVTVKLRGNLLSVRLRNAAWETVLMELQRQTGIVIETNGKLSGAMTAEFENRPLEEAIEGLFRDFNRVSFYAEGAAGEAFRRRLTHVLLLPKTGASATTQAPNPSAEVAPVKPAWDPEMDRATRLRRLDALSIAGDSEAVQEALADPDRDVQAKALEILLAREGPGALDRLVALTKSEDSAIQLQALTLLNESGHADEVTALSALGNAVSNTVRNVKEYAIESLARRSDSQALEYLSQVSLDPDPNVRMTILENVAQYGGRTALLQQALSDEDEKVRTLAAFLLKQLTEVSNLRLTTHDPSYEND
jgi:hypothetical protein